MRVVWLSLSTRSVLRTLEWFPAALRRYADSVGKPDLYHETITWALVLLIHDRKRRGSPASSWEKFAADNPDLFLWPGVVERYYRRATLESREAREFFVLPDRLDTGARESAPGNQAKASG